jgi:hypothetical protein
MSLAQSANSWDFALVPASCARYLAREPPPSVHAKPCNVDPVATDITDAIRAREVHDRELAQLLISKFGKAQFTSATRIDMPDAEEPEVSIVYTSGGILQRVETLLSDSWVVETRGEIEEKLLAPTVSKVSRKFAFADQPVTGGWACDFFAIAPAPDNAPRPPILLADHPFVLEVPFDATADPYFNVQRADSLCDEWALLLSLFVTSFKGTMSRSPQHRWGLEMGPVNSNEQRDDLTPQLFQDWYWIEGFESLADGFSAAQTSLPVTPDDIYYARRGIAAGDVLDIPSSLGEWVNKYAARSFTRRSQVLRAAYWLRHAREVFLLSHSASLVAAVQAVEVLLPTTSRARCGTCDQLMGPGPTKQFADFLDAYAPAEDDESAGARKAMYSQRSRLAHGHGLLSADAQVGWNHPATAHEHQLLSETHRVARVAIINWFRSA